jgi:quercetin dioxygenase-like cupin family protein
MPRPAGPADVRAPILALVVALAVMAPLACATRASLEWGPPPASLPPGARMALVHGDPRKPGPFTVRFRLPDGFTVPPHFHPADEHVLVIRGHYAHGFGDVVDTTRMRWLAPGQRAVLPAGSHHYTRARGDTETEVSGMGPFTVTYVR